MTSLEIPHVPPPVSFRVPRTLDLASYAGFILTYRSINIEFKAEWTKPYNVYLSSLPGSAKPVAKLSDSRHIQFDNHAQISRLLITRLAANLASFEISLPFSDSVGKVAMHLLAHGLLGGTDYIVCIL
jgi:hypothetical protein